MLPVLAAGSRSLRFKLIVATVSASMVFIWALAWISSNVVRSQFERILSDQQFAAARYAAAELDNKLAERINGLARLATLLAAANFAETAKLERFLAERPVLVSFFTGGMVVIGLDGKAVCDYPAAAGRRGSYYGDRDYFIEALRRGRPYVGKPVVGRILKRPVLAIAVPIVGDDGRARGVLTGITDLSAPNFLGLISDRNLVGEGEFFVMSAADNVMIAATDAGRALAELPAEGVNPMKDRFFAGYEGSGISTTSSGVVKLMSGKRLNNADWIVEAALPVEVAFQPVDLLRSYLYTTAATLTVLAVLFIVWMTRRILVPLERANAQLEAMSADRAPLQELPAAGDSDVRSLMRSFNRLIGKMRALAVHQEGILEDERKHIAREIHDELGQLLTALKMELSLLRMQWGGDPMLRKKIEEMRATVDRAIDVVRHVASNLRPAALDLGLLAAIQWLAEDFGHRWEIPCAVDAQLGHAIVAEAQATAAFRLVQESLTNVARHARATAVAISLQQQDGHLLVTVRDNGVGFDPNDAAQRRSFGLFGMRERALSLGGSVHFDSAPGKGTAVHIDIPLASVVAARAAKQ